MKTIIPDGLADEYIRKRLLQGSILAEKAISIDLGRGITSTYLPDRLAEKIPPFDIGGLFDIEEARQTEEQVAREIVEYLKSGMNRCVIFDDLLHRPGERSIDDKCYFHCRGQVFLYSDSRLSFSFKEIKALMSVASPWPFIALLTRWTQRPEFASGSEISEKDLMQLAENIEGIIINAWDDEGYLLWKIREGASSNS